MVFRWDHRAGRNGLERKADGWLFKLDQWVDQRARWQLGAPSSAQGKGISG
ncbi:MAG: hypothetical protein IPI00_18040 [Flavobacteriales bacterium]|nr:hypothetical protein [Flavobacteriales bacterium]MBK7242001.1 hypothetical protein [Flavobacteriales bacterium]